MLVKDHKNELQPNTWYILHSPLYKFKVYAMACIVFEHGKVETHIRYISPSGFIEQAHMQTLIITYPDVTATLVDKVKITVTSEEYCRDQTREYDNDLRDKLCC